MEIKNNNENKNNFDNEMGTLEKFFSELKNAFFGVSFVILAEQEFSVFAALGMTFFLFLQLLMFPFHPTVNMIWSSPKIVEIVDAVVNVMNLVNYLKKTNWTIYISFFYVNTMTIFNTIVLIFYVSFLFTRRKAKFSKALIALRYLVGSLVTNMFLPLLNYIVSILACVEDPKTGLSVHSYFTQIECWSGIHIAHAIAAILAIPILLGICLPLGHVCFEYRDGTVDPTARVNGKPILHLMVYEAIMIITLTFLTEEEFQILLLALMLIGSIFLFGKLYFSFPFHNDIIGKAFATFAAINMWTVIMLVFAKIMETTLFEGSIIAWLVGIPFVILVMLTNRDPRIELLLVNVNKFTSGEEVHQQARFLLKLIEWQASNQNSAMLLDGYLEIHKQSCNKEDCPLKQKCVKNNRFAKTLMSISF